MEYANNDPENAHEELLKRQIQARNGENIR